MELEMKQTGPLRLNGNGGPQSFVHISKTREFLTIWSVFLEAYIPHERTDQGAKAFFWKVFDTWVRSSL